MPRSPAAANVLRRGPSGHAPGEKVAERRKIVIPLDHGRHIPKPPADFRVKRPDVAGHGLIVRVDLMGSMIRMSGEMNLDNPVTGNRIDEFQRIEIMVEGGNKDVVHIEQEPAIGPLAQFPDKRPFIHFGLGESHITRHVFDCYAAPEKILNPPNPVNDMA
jgi:hypothetical protein